MSVSVTIPTLLRPLTNGEKSVQAQGACVADVINHLDHQFPGIKEKLVSGDALHRFVNVYINDNDVRFADGLKTPVQAGDNLTVLPAVAGG